MRIDAMNLAPSMSPPSRGPCAWQLCADGRGLYTADGILPKVDQQTKKRLVDVCGHDYLHAANACCSRSQIDQLASTFRTYDLLWRDCPACEANIKSLLCSFTRSSTQAQYTTTIPSRSGSRTHDLSFTVHPFWARESFDSSHRVLSRSNYDYAMYMLGGGVPINPDEFLSVLKGIQPFAANVSFVASEDKTSLLPPTYDCNDTTLGLASSCYICDNMCPVNEALPLPTAHACLVLIPAGIRPFLHNTHCVSFYAYVKFSREFRRSTETNGQLMEARRP